MWQILVEAQIELWVEILSYWDILVTNYVYTILHLFSQ
jgi:hypothetical protein